MLNKNRHIIYDLEYLLVIVTKYRNKILTENVAKRLLEIARNLFETNWNCRIFEINTEYDHIHVMFEAPPQVKLSKLINNFKTVSSLLLRKEFADYLSKFYWKPFFWSNSYFVASVSERTHKTLQEYIRNQDISYFAPNRA
ncbi:MAG: IS200/IS605 family transposase [Oscillospiraceae bacterium]|nr:IS200/IS605 family transposase [Oscillospiraceae bacterium]